ncbi:MAG: HipA domain-containing protein [Phormidesmis sp. FL-bin-119]|nr:HipA domain-containing protein [Pedobacter sp.]
MPYLRQSLPASCLRADTRNASKHWSVFSPWIRARRTLGSHNRLKTLFYTLPKVNAGLLRYVQARIENMLCAVKKQNAADRQSTSQVKDIPGPTARDPSSGLVQIIQLFQCMRELKLTYAEAEEMFRRMVFNVVARNCDDHTKNFSFLLKKGGRWELSPAYHLCHAYRPGSEWVSQHALSINGKRKAITKADLMVIGESIRCKKASDIVEEINDMVNQWKGFADKVGVEAGLRDEIGGTLVDLGK